MTRLFRSKEFSPTTAGSTKTFILATLAVLLVGCGGGGDDFAVTCGGHSCINNDSDDEPGNSPAEQGVINIICFIVSLGQTECLENDGSSPPPTSTTTVPESRCNGPDRCIEGATTAYAVAFDVEPNDSTSTAFAVSLPNPSDPEQRRGFFADGTINNLTDGVDTYGFTVARSRIFGLQICDPTPPDICRNGSLSLAVARFSVLDQFGNVVLSSQGGNVKGNYQEMPIDAGVLYYVMVIAEGTANRDREYTLRVFETIGQPEPEVLEESDPSAPILSAGEATFLTITLDWMPPTMNVDGTPLLDLVGYNVYFGPESGMYLDFRHLDNPGLATYVLDLPSSGTWYIAITASDSMGVESDFSNEVSVDVICECDLPPAGEMI